MGSANQLYPALCNGARGHGFQFPADFINHNYLGVVIFHRFNHHLVL